MELSRCLIDIVVDDCCKPFLNVHPHISHAYIGDFLEARIVVGLISFSQAISLAHILPQMKEDVVTLHDIAFWLLHGVESGIVFEANHLTLIFLYAGLFYFPTLACVSEESLIENGLDILVGCLLVAGWIQKQSFCTFWIDDNED